MQLVGCVQVGNDVSGFWLMLDRDKYFDKSDKSSCSSIEHR